MKNKVAEWLRGCPDTSEVSPVTVTIGKQTYHGAKYRQRGEESIYLVGELPASYRHSTHVAIGSPMIRGNGTSGAIGKGRLAPPIKSIITPSGIRSFSSPGATMNLSTTGRENRIGECQQPSESKMHYLYLFASEGPFPERVVISDADPARIRELRGMARAIGDKGRRN